MDSCWIREGLCWHGTWSVMKYKLGAEISLVDDIQLARKIAELEGRSQRLQALCRAFTIEFGLIPLE